MPQSQRRHRKIAILTPLGLQKLQTAISESDLWNPYTKSATLEALSEQTGLSINTLSKVHNRQVNVDLRTLNRYFNAFNLTLEAGDYICPVQVARMRSPVSGRSSGELPVMPSPSPTTTVHWGTAPDVSAFYDRAAELATLTRWIGEERCRLISLVGMEGIGKTWLVAKLAEQIQSEFEMVIWHSLRPIKRGLPSIPSVPDFLDDLIRYFTPRSETHLLENIDGKILFLLDRLRQTRSLLIVDHVDVVLQCPPHVESDRRSYQPGSDSEEYEELFQYLGQGRHPSCVVLTSREEPKKIQRSTGNHSPIRVLPLEGLPVTGARQIFRARGIFRGSPSEWERLITYYGGNPLMLEIVAATIERLFNSNLTEFFDNGTPIFDEIRELLDRQFDGLSPIEKTVIEVLAKQDSPLEFTELRSRVSPKISTTVLLALLKSMKARSLLEKTTKFFSLPPLLKDYRRERHPVRSMIYGDFPRVL
ncbi:helix-turn-helix transcriptional regulator [Pannus brasiliensis CCIBt3594]|uniref:Helix-turn-helix transcriptional regulator n=1 Tax=Pannus brasiliensis CCIBt3594 TaxID=1427578 RepID=A0AAW9QWP5_9CHRO